MVATGKMGLRNPMEAGPKAAYRPPVGSTFAWQFK